MSKVNFIEGKPYCPYCGKKLTPWPEEIFQETYEFLCKPCKTTWVKEEFHELASLMNSVTEEDFEEYERNKINK